MTAHNYNAWMTGRPCPACDWGRRVSPGHAVALGIAFAVAGALAGWVAGAPLKPVRSLPVGPGLGARVEVEAASRCPCPAPEGSCSVPCTARCDDKATPEVEQCPCDPTAAQ